MPLMVSCKAKILCERRKNGRGDTLNNISANTELVRKELPQSKVCPSSTSSAPKYPFILLEVI